MPSHTAQPACRSPGIMVPEDHRLWKIKTGHLGDNLDSLVAEIAHEQDDVCVKCLDRCCIPLIPLVMNVADEDQATAA